jgi:HEAT repeat protein
MGTDNNWNAEFRRALAARRAVVRIVRTLNGMSSSRYYDVRMEVLEALSDCASEFDLESLVRKGIRDRDELVRVTAIEIAGDHGLKSMQDEIIRRLKSDRSGLVRSKAAIALGEMHALEARKILEDRLGRAGDEERLGFYYALVKLGARKHLDALLQGLTHDFYRIRCATASLIPGLVEKTDKRLLIRRLREALEHEETVAARSSLESALKELSNGG